MRRFPGVVLSAVAVVLISGAAKGKVAAAESNSTEEKAAAESKKLALGKQLFEHEWKVNDALSHGGDGLGPMFNATSCVACHNQGGVGGGGAVEHNVDVLVLLKFKNQRRLSSGPKRAGGTFTSPSIEVDKPNSNPVLRPSPSNPPVLAQIVPGFAVAVSVPIHRFGPSANYEEYRAGLLGLRPNGEIKAPRGKFATRHQWIHRDMHVKDPSGVVKYVNPGTMKIDELVVHPVQRNTPSLFGSGLIDKVTQAELEAIAQQQGGGVTGQPRFVASKGDMAGQVAGRFGWRGQKRTLRAFVLGACANELGLQTHRNPQPPDPWQSNKGPAPSDKHDMTTEQVAAMIHFVASLPPPKALPPKDAAHQAALKRGEVLFAQASCSVCHVKDVGPAHGVYSDLLVHAMGDRLSDPKAIVDERPLAREQARRRAAQLALSSSAVPPGGIASPPSTPSGSSVSPSAADEFEDTSVATSFDTSYNGDGSGGDAWRTPPLWGVRDSAPYMHDGRAATIDQAILLHGGQGATSVAAYKKLTDEEKSDLVAFVHSLGAP